MQIARLFIVLSATVGLCSSLLIHQAFAQTLETLVVHTSEGTQSFQVEVADTPQERAQGLMGRNQMPARQGMIFDFGGTQQVRMWMKDTPLSLDMIFIRADGKVHRVVSHTDPFSEAHIESNGRVRAVLELNAGTANASGVRVGDTVQHRLFANTQGD